MSAYALVDLILTVFGMFLGLWRALVTSMLMQTAKNVIFYVRLDSIGSPNFSSYAGAIRLDLSHNNPTLITFANQLDNKTQEVYIKNSKETDSDNPVMLEKELKYKNYWYLLSTLNNNLQFSQRRASERSIHYSKLAPKTSRLKQLRNKLKPVFNSTRKQSSSKSIETTADLKQPLLE
jgi:hypothetical protein